MTQENKIPVSYRFNTAKEWSNGFLESKVDIEEGILPVVTGYILSDAEDGSSENLSPKVVAALFYMDGLKRR